MQSLIPTAVVTALLAAPAATQSASFTFFGSASGDTSAGQQLTVSGLPRLGTTFSLGVDYATPPSFCLQVLTPYSVWMALGLSNQSWQGVSLPLSIPPGFDLLVSPDVVLQSLVTSTTSCPPGATTPFGPTFPVTVPNVAGLVGLQFHAQLLLARAGVTTGLPLATNGGTATVGL